MPRATSRPGDTVDLVCWRELGTTEGGIVESTLDANPGLSAEAVLPAGTPIDLPQPRAPGGARTLELIQLWD